MDSNQKFFTTLDDDEEEVSSIDLAFLKEAVIAFQASTSTILKTPTYQSTITIYRDRYGAHDRLVAVYFSENSMYDEKLFRKRF